MLTFLLDEDVARKLFHAVIRHNADPSRLPLDVIHVGQTAAPPLSTPDPDVIAFAAASGRLLVSRDKQSMPGHLRGFLAAGGHSPGVLFVRPGFRIPELMDALELIAHAGFADDYRDKVGFIP